MNIYDVYADTPESEPKIRSTLGSKNAAARALRSSREYEIAREKFLFRAKHQHNKDGSKGAPCWLCNQPIDYRLKYPHPRSWSLDHAVPIKQNPALILNPSNFRSAHLDCNNHRQSDAPRIELGEPSEAW